MATIPNVAKGKLAEWATLPATNDALIAVLLQSTGVETEATLRDYTTLSAILAAANDEPTSTGYSRQTLTGVAINIDQANDRVDIDCNDPSWTFTAGVQNIGALVICYDNDTTAGNDTNLIPIFVDVFGSAFVPTVSVAFTYQVATSGFARVS